MSNQLISWTQIASWFKSNFFWIPLNEVIRLLRPVATMLAMWTNGPSFPSGIPAPNTHISPIAFEMGCMRSIDLYQETWSVQWSSPMISSTKTLKSKSARRSALGKLNLKIQKWWNNLLLNVQKIIQSWWSQQMCYIIVSLSLDTTYTIYRCI